MSNVARTGSNLANRNFIPAIWTKKVLINFYNTAVAKAICNTDYIGEIKNGGDSVQIRQIGSLTLKDYTVNADINWTALPDDKQTLYVDQSKYIAFKVDDVDQVQQDINALNEYTKEGAYAIADDFDSYILGLHAGATGTYGSTGSPVDCGYGTSEISPLDVMGQMSYLLNIKNVPTQNRWIVVPPAFVKEMMKEDSVLIQADTMGDSASAAKNGFIKNMLGFSIYMSNNIATDGTYFALMAGTKHGISAAQQVTKTEKVRLTTTFADGIRMLSVYGAKVVKADALATAYCKFD